MDVIPKTDKRESEEETKNPPKFCHQVGQGVDQLLCLYLSLLRHCPKREEQVVRLRKSFRRIDRWIPVPDKCVLLVLARFDTSCELLDLA